MVPQQGYVSISRRPPDVEDYIDIVRRYRSWIIAPMFAGLVLSVVIAFFWPDTYISTAVMRITPQQIPERLVQSNISTLMAERLSAMQQEILSRSSLSELVQKPSLDLYKRDRQRKPMEDVIEEMRKNIRILILDTPSAQTRNRAASAFQISFAYSDRYKAQAVVRELVTKFTEQNITVQRTQASLTTSFLNDELKVASENLERLDGDITQFKTENQGRLPEQLQSNLQTLNALQLQLASVNEAINRNGQEKLMLETQLQNLNNQSSFILANMEETVATQTVKNDRLMQLNKAILDQETGLAAALESYKPEHPDIRSFKKRLEVLKRERDILIKEEERQQSNTGPVAQGGQSADGAGARKSQVANGHRKGADPDQEPGHRGPRQAAGRVEPLHPELPDAHRCEPG